MEAMSEIEMQILDLLDTIKNEACNDSSSLQESPFDIVFYEDGYARIRRTAFIPTSSITKVEFYENIPSPWVISNSTQYWSIRVCCGDDCYIGGIYFSEVSAMNAAENIMREALSYSRQAFQRKKEI